VTRFIKLFGMSFHGISRSPEAERATEAGPAALLAMVMAAVMCLLLGVLPTYAIGALDRAVQPRSRTPGRRKPLCRRFCRGVRVTTSYPEILWESSPQRLQVGMEVFPRGRWNQALAGDDLAADHAFDILLAAGGPGQLDPMCNACPEESIGRAMPRRRRCIS